MTGVDDFLQAESINEKFQFSKDDDLNQSSLHLNSITEGKQKGQKIV